MGYLEMAKWFDENLYTELTPPSADFSFVRNDQLFEFCDSPVVEEDLFAALSTRKRTRSPGSDVLTVKFHIKLWKVLGKPFTPLVNRLLHEGTPPATKRKGLITLLYGISPAQRDQLSRLLVAAKRVVVPDLLEALRFLARPCSLDPSRLGWEDPRLAHWLLDPNQGEAKFVNMVDRWAPHLEPLLGR
ncbi:hypothetical protein MRX96_041764 [Rhipicephalus microplus]